jgi:hypothetical protein
MRSLTGRQGPCKSPHVARFFKVEHMGLFIIVAVLGAAWLIFTA